MPLSRYQIRNEYSLADPELYKAADKDDPEALLEGVAMAGLVGVLRQLGDLAEFAAEIFHDLHEEVMVTAARGHSLTARVQQLESEFPAIEKAFLSQTNHSSFFYNPGSDWHPNIRVDQSLIARGDLPRFVMDSYEECRGPPRLFLLDKFDVAGAGACLKRYSDPSFFKSEPLSFGITGTDVQREKKVRKAKKKGSRWRNGETQDALPTSNAKLHQLFLEERITNGFGDPARRAKLKRRLNGFPFSSKSGESYMEKFLKSPSPDNKEVHEIPVDSSTYESSFEIATISAVSPEKELDPRSINLSSSPPKEEIIPELFVDKLNEVPSGTRDSVMLQSDSDYVSDIGVESYNIPSTLEMEDSVKEIAVDCGSKTDESINNYQYDDIASEIDNYMDALPTMESEMDTDSDIKIKNGKREARDSYANGVQLHAHSSDSQSMENSALSDGGNSSSKKEISSFSNSDTHSAAENTHSGAEVSSDVFPSTEIHETKIVDSSLDPLPISREIPWSNPRGSFVTDGLFTEAAKIPSQISELSDQTASLSASDSDPSFTKEGALMFTEADEIVANSSLNIPQIPIISEATEEKDYDSPLRLSDENQLMDESEGGDKNPSLDVPHIPNISEATEEKDFDFPKRLSGENQFVDETEGGDKDPSLDIPHIPSISEATEDIDYDSPRRLSGENQFVNESGGGDKDKSEIVPDTSYLSVSSHSKDDFLLHALTENQLISELNDEDVNPDENVVSLTNQNLNDDSGPPLINHENSSLLSTSDQPLDELHPEDQDLGENAPLVPNLSDSPSQLGDGFPVAVSADGYQTSTADGLSNKAAEEKGGQSTVDSLPKSGTNEDLHIPNSDGNQTGEQNPVMPLNDGQPLGQTLYLDADAAGDTFSEVDGIGGSAGEISDNVTPKEDTSSELVEYLVPETNAEVPPIRSSEEQTSFGREVEPLDRVDGAELGACDTNVSERDATAEPLLLAGSHIGLDKIDTDSVNVPAENNAVDDDYGPSGDLRTSTEVCFLDSEGEVKGLATEESGLSEIPEDLCTTDGLHRQIFSLQNSDSCQVVDNDQSESESQVVNDVSAAYLLLATKDNSDATTATEVQLPSEENKLESSHTEENVELLTNKLDQSCVLEANSEVVSNLDQACHEKLIDHVGPTSSNSLPGYLPHDSSETELSSLGRNDINTSGHPVYPSTSILSSFPLIPNASEIHVDEMPPMPPLPPVQWRMTKFQHALPGKGRLFVQNNASAFPPMFPCKADRDTQPVNQLLPESALGYGNSHPVSEQPIGTADHLNPFISQGPSVVHHGNLKDNILTQEDIQQTGISQLAGSGGEVLQNSLQGEEGENEKPGLISSSNLSPADRTPTYALGFSREKDTGSLNEGAPETSLNEELVQSPTITGENVVTSHTRTLPSKTEYEQPEQTMPAPAHAFGLSNEKLIRPLNQVALETSIKDQELGNRSGHSDENLGSYDNNPVSEKAQDEDPQPALSTSEATLAWPIGEEIKANGLRPMKLPRPRNPLIDDVAALDKSKLRKVTDRIRPEMQEEDERDSILEQIRTKSFNLKPAVVTRPSIPGPTTNLKVAAILEKAKTIRQAFAGSDDDDDDSWSE